MEVLKNLLPAPVRRWLGMRRRQFHHSLLTFDAVKNFAALRRVKPYRPGFGSHRGECIDRYYIRAFLGTYREDIAGRVLEVQSDQYTQMLGGGQVTQCDILDVDENNPKCNIVADLTHCPEIADNTYDCVICTQTLLLIYDVPAAVRELHRIVKPNGVVLATVPGIAQLCEPNMVGGAGQDYWRFTGASAAKLFGEAFGDENVVITTYGNVLSAISFLHGLIVPELTSEELDYQDPGYPVIVAARARKL